MWEELLQLLLCLLVFAAAASASATEDSRYAFHHLFFLAVAAAAIARHVVFFFLFSVLWGFCRVLVADKGINDKMKIEGEEERITVWPRPQSTLLQRATALPCIALTVV